MKKKKIMPNYNKPKLLAKDQTTQINHFACNPKISGCLIK